MTALAASLAYLGTLAFVAWVLWLRARSQPPLASIVQALSDAVRELQAASTDTRAIVDNLSLKSGLSLKR